MSNKKSFSRLLLFLPLILAEGLVHAAPPKRISSKYVDLSKVQTIYMVPGMATLIEIPENVSGIRIGDPDSIVYFKPEHPDNEVTVILKATTAKPTNLIIRGGSKKYVFDIIPSKVIHQDAIQILGAYGSPAVDISNATLLESSEGPSK